jgi:hypothetical protein
MSDDTATGIAEGTQIGFGEPYSFAHVTARVVVESVKVDAGAAAGQ